MLFVYNLMNGSIDSPELVDKISFVIPSFNLRSPSTFKMNSHTPNHPLRLTLNIYGL